ncbi:MAG TPA: hypothetical protein VII94_04930 [Candidatus Saccharimonadales bacterium]
MTQTKSIEHMMAWFFQTIDQDKPVCLYCKGKCMVDSQAIADGKNYYYRYTCPHCSDFYTLYTILDDKWPNPVCYNFDFTCGDFIICLAGSESFAIRMRAPKETKPIIVPLFELNFSNKKSLIDKIKTYAV